MKRRLFTLNLDLENDAFHGADRDHEVARILEHAAKLVMNGAERTELSDANGNSVGSYEFYTEDKDD